MIQKKNNYDETAKYARTLFMKENQEKLIQKFNLVADSSYIYIRFMDLIYRINREDGTIEKATEHQKYEHENDYRVTMALFDYLCWSKEDRRLSGAWMSEQTMGHSFHTSLLEGAGSLFAKAAEYFEGHTEALIKVCEGLNGEKMAVGDVSYILKLFDELPIYFQFWLGDEELPSKIFFLWDSNTQQYIHYETTYYILDLFLERITELVTQVTT